MLLLQRPGRDGGGAQVMEPQILQGFAGPQGLPGSRKLNGLPGTKLADHSKGATVRRWWRRNGVNVINTCVFMKYV